MITQKQADTLKRLIREHVNRQIDLVLEHERHGVPDFHTKLAGQSASESLQEFINGLTEAKI